jgi:transposase
VVALGLDETSFLKATRLAPTQWVTGLVDLERGRLLDVVADRTRAAIDGWLGARPCAWLARIGTVALDPWRGYASALVAPLGHARVVVDTSTPSGWPTRWSIRSAGGPSRPPRGIEAASAIRCTASASCC